MRKVRLSAIATDFKELTYSGILLTVSEIVQENK
jgi:hypothetical protein